MVTRTYYFPRNQLGRYILNYLIEHIGCSVGKFGHVADTFSVVITVSQRDITKVEHILEMYGLM